MGERQGYYDTHEVPTYKYIYISGVAIHKAFTFWLIVAISVFWNIANPILYFTNWWQLLFISVATFIWWDNAIVGWPATGIAVTVGYVWWHYRQKRLKRERIQKERARKIQDIMLGGGERKRKR